MNKTILAVAAPLATLLAVLPPAQAQTYVLVPPYVPGPPPARFLVGMGVSGGGDQLVSARNDRGETATVHGGGLVYLTAGVDYHLSPTFALQGTINYHVDSVNSRHGDVSFERFPVELIAYYQPNPGFRVGGGVRYTTGTKLSGTGAASDMDVSFDNTTSAVVEAEYFPYLDVGIKLRYVNETFEARNYGKVDGSHVGLSVNIYF